MKPILLTAVLCSLALAAPARAADEDIEALKTEAAEIVASFAQELQGALMTAMKEGGPVNAIDICNEKAPEIAASAAAASGWSVARSSHRLRNPENAPDAYTAAAIAREAAGEPAKGLARAEIVEEGGRQVFRFVKAIPTGQPCLNCHGGEDVKPEVVAKLAELYPDDAARGFSVDQMRGVFTLSKVVAD